MALPGSILFLVLVGSSVSGTSGLKTTAEPGENVTLPCRDPNSNRMLLLEWSKPNPKWEEMLYSCMNDGVLLDQDEYFQNRVSLNNSQMKDGDLSVVLENVKINDTGIYECKATYENDTHIETKLISTVVLWVSPGDEGGRRGVSHGRLGLIDVSGLLLVFLVLPAVVVWIYKKRKCSNQSSGGSNNLKNPDRGLLISV